jgi:hypothetical protein
MRRLVAFLFHAPGMWLFHREPLPRRLIAPNLIAAALTVIAAAVAFHWRGGWAALAVWAAGHVAWGGVLAVCL